MKRVPVGSKPHGYIDCVPTLIDAITGVPEPNDSPVMKAVFKVWESTSAEDRAAYHRYCCLNSKKPRDIERTEALCERFKQAAERATLS